MRKWERGGWGLWEREAARERWVLDWVCEREAVRVRIIKNYKKKNILLNKSVE